MSDKMLKLHLESFQGPFDLLLHLIKQMEVDIHDIPMTEITNQYLAYIHSMESLELDIIGDYLVMAATLMEIKSRLLLPIEPDPELESDYEQGDPRDALVQQLLLYQQFQTVATQLELRQEDRAGLYNRPTMDITHLQEAVPLQEGAISMDMLSEAMAYALEKFATRQPLEREVHQDSLTISDQMDKIYAAFQQVQRNGRLLFAEILERGSASEVVTTFLAMLELVKNQKIIFHQPTLQSEIEMEWIG